MLPKETTPRLGEIERLAEVMGQPLEGDAPSLLGDFCELFLTWNARINLGGARIAEDMVGRHLSDAFAAVRFVSGRDRVIDVGSGGGLPAIPMALLRREARFDLYEPTAKKVAFLRTAIRRLGIGDRVRVHPERVELPPPAALGSAFDVACSRATLAPPSWVPLGLSLVRSGGLVLAFVTGDAVLGCPEPTQEVVYGRNRRLLTFVRGAPVPAGI